MLQLAASSNFLVSPSAGLFLYTVLVVVVLLCALVTAIKGRWGWLLAGIFTFGICWVVGAFQSAQPGSAWAKVSAARHAQI